METIFRFLRHFATLPGGDLTEEAEKQAIGLGRKARDEKWRPMVFASPLLGAKRTAALFILGHGPYENNVDSGPAGSFTLDTLQMTTRGILVSLKTSLEDSPIEFRVPPPELMALTENQSEEILALIRTNPTVFAFAVKRVELVARLVHEILEKIPGKQILIISHTILIELSLLTLHDPKIQPEELFNHPIHLLSPGEAYRVVFDKNGEMFESNYQSFGKNPSN